MVRYLAHKWYLRTSLDVTQSLRHDKVLAMVLRRDDSRSEWCGFVYFMSALSEAAVRRELGLPDADEDTGTCVLSPLCPGAEFRYQALKQHPPESMHLYARDPRVWQKKRHHYWVDRSKRYLTVY